MGLQFWYSHGANAYVVADTETGDVEDILDTAGEVADKYGDIYHVVGSECYERCQVCSDLHQ